MFNKSIIIIYLLVTLFNSQLFPQWAKVNGPYGSGSNCIVSIGNTVFASAYGIYRSTDFGDRWYQVKNGLPDLHAYTLAVNGTTIFAGTTKGVYASVDNGDTWILANEGLGTNTVFSFAFVGTYCFAATTNGIFRSTNNGKNWTSSNNGLDNLNITAIAAGGNNLIASTYTSYPAKIFLSTDSGSSWKSISQNTNFGKVQSLLVKDTLIIAGLSDLGFRRSSINGSTWETINNGYGNISFIVNSLTCFGDNIFAGTWKGVYYSNNNGDSWSQLNSGLGDIKLNMVSYCAGYLFAGGAGIFRSANLGANWTDISNTISNPYILSFASDGANFYTGTQKGLYRTTDDGLNWTNISINSTYNSYSDITVDKGNLYTIASVVLFCSADTGSHWTNCSKGLSGDIKGIAVNGTNILAGKSDGIFRSTNNGASWNKVYTTNGLMDTSPFLFTENTALAGIQIYAGHSIYKAYMLCSTDQGVTWTDASNGIDFGFIYSIARFDSLIFLGSMSGTYKSIDYGKSWIKLNNFTSASVYNFATSNKSIFAATYKGVFVSNDFGEHWEELNDGLNDKSLLNAVAVHGSYVYAGTQRGLYRRPLGEATEVSRQSNTIPDKFLLKQNYPNPFNPSTNISFSIPKESFVTLKVFDALGREVAELVNEKLYAGSYTKQFTKNGLPSGIYFYRLQADNYSDTKKLILLK